LKNWYNKNFNLFCEWYWSILQNKIDRLHFIPHNFENVFRSRLNRKKTLQKDLPLENFISQDVILRWFLFKAVEDNTRLLESRLNKQTPNEIKIEKEVNKLQEKLDKMNLELEKVSGVGGGFNDRGVYYFSKIIPKF